MLVSDFDYDLPVRLIAQQPADRRDQSRLLVTDRATGSFSDSIFHRLPDYLHPGDVLVLNNTRVFPARLIGRRLLKEPKGALLAAQADKTNDLRDRNVKPAMSADSESGAAAPRVEIFLVREIRPLLWEALVRPGRALQPGAIVQFGEGELTAEIVERFDSGRRVVRFQTEEEFDRVIDRIGSTPLPPYIKRERKADSESYQTVYASQRGAIAAPTAGLHFTADLLDRLRRGGVEIVEITLHVGYGTFQPVRVETVEDHRVESEAYTISEEAAGRLNRALAESRRIIAVGTTTARALESAALESAALDSAAQLEDPVVEGRSDPRSLSRSSSSATGIRTESEIGATVIRSGTATTDLFIYPGYRFRVLSGLVTNFHLPKSSLLMLVSAFAGRELILNAYRHAVEHDYRFYSYGDAMLIL